MGFYERGGCAWIFVRRFVALFLHSCSSSRQFVCLLLDFGSTCFFSNF